MEKYYKFLGIKKDSSDEEIELAYKSLKEKYSEDRFLEGDAGKIASQNLSKLEYAYTQIKNDRNAQSGLNCFSEVEDLIRKGDIEGAQRKLDDFNERNAEWHYYQALIFYKKSWTNECRKQLEIAISIEPNNEKYKEELRKLDQKVEYENAQYKQTYQNGGQTQANQQMGGDGCAMCVDCCTTWMCCNCLTNSCCR